MRKLSHDPLSGITTWHDYDHHAKKRRIIYQNDPSIEWANISANKREQNEGKYNFHGKKGKEMGMRKVARFTPWAQMLWLNKYGYSPLDRRFLKQTVKNLNDPEWKYLKTSSEKL